MTPVREVHQPCSERHGSRQFAETAWYKTKLNAYGLPLDTRHTYAKTGASFIYCFARVLITSVSPSDWAIWTAGIVSDTTTRNQIIDSIVKYVSSGLNSQPLGDWYETTNGNVNGFKARPVAGGHLALVSYRVGCARQAKIDSYAAVARPVRTGSKKQTAFLLCDCANRYS